MFGRFSCCLLIFAFSNLIFLAPVVEAGLLPQIPKLFQEYEESLKYYRDRCEKGASIKERYQILDRIQKKYEGKHERMTPMLTLTDIVLEREELDKAVAHGKTTAPVAWKKERAAAARWAYFEWLFGPGLISAALLPQLAPEGSARIPIFWVTLLGSGLPVYYWTKSVWRCNDDTEKIKRLPFNTLLPPLGLLGIPYWVGMGNGFGFIPYSVSKYIGWTFIPLSLVAGVIHSNRVEWYWTEEQHKIFNGTLNGALLGSFPVVVWNVTSAAQASGRDEPWSYNESLTRSVAFWATFIGGGYIGRKIAQRKLKTHPPVKEEDIFEKQGSFLWLENNKLSLGMPVFYPKVNSGIMANAFVWRF